MALSFPVIGRLFPSFSYHRKNQPKPKNKNHMKSIITLSILFAAGTCLAGEFVSMFDGKGLDGWTQRNGTADYVVEDGTIKGTTKSGSPNSFLCSNKEYGDFELEFEVKCHNSLNSGVQIRSQTKDTPTGRVNGPQVEIEASPGQSGLIYGEAAGGWMSAKEKTDAQHKQFKNGEWNAYKVIAKGARIQTWINGEAVEDLTDDEKLKTHPKGFIGLQVHGIGKKDDKWSVAWRNIKIKEL
ncbi:MAG: hypothetical protein ACI9TH_004128 [Kiritimatiellia bacterium]